LSPQPQPTNPVPGEAELRLFVSWSDFDFR
jgi:hypothetical protein